MADFGLHKFYYSNVPALPPTRKAEKNRKLEEHKQLNDFSTLFWIRCKAARQKIPASLFGLALGVKMLPSETGEKT